MTKYPINYNNQTGVANFADFTGGAAFADVAADANDAAVANDQVFHIYTTGIINWGTFDDPTQNLIAAWNNGVREALIQKIPQNFNISLHHYDPILGIGQHEQPMQPIQGEDRQRQIDYAHANLIPGDFGNGRVVATEFIDRGFDAGRGIQNPHLVIDLAHIFQYPYNIGTVIPGGNYGEGVGQPIPINSLRTGFLGNGFGAILGLADTVRVSDVGVVETYVDRMIARGDQYNIDNPSDFIENIYERLRVSIENAVKRLKDNAPLFRVQHIIDAIRPDPIVLVNSILARLWNDFTIERIIEEITEHQIQVNIEVITAMNPLE